MTHPKGKPSHVVEIYYIVCIVLFVVIAMFGVWGPGGVLELKKARQDLEVQRARVEEQQRSNQQRLRAIEALRSDKEALEGLARENGYGRPGEVIQQLPEDSKAKAQPEK